MKRLKLNASLFSFICLSGAALAQTANETNTSSETQANAPSQPPAPCQSAEYRQMDFWVGEWDLTWQAADGTTRSGQNVIRRSPFGDCVITENFDGAPGNKLKGMSVSTYSKPHGQWRQTWVDNQGGYFSLHGGLQDEGTFILEMDRLNDKGPYSRMVFEDVKPDSLTWRWQGKGEAEAEWADRWVVNYRRR
ncbi:hypothetical protein [Litorimonas haliclonae]|uniref:hypothetical protein n=1 Tax=Litorimonas haliclonae TaxID=2081977 RepID=UPI0039EF1493